MSEPTLLDALLEVIDTATDDGWDQPATLWFAAADPTADTGITIGHKVVGGHPFDSLLGFTAPDEWTVLGVTCCGWAGSMDADVPPSMQEHRRRVRQTFLLGRSGATASAVSFQDGGEPWVTTEAPGTGRMLDVLQRCLGLPTRPPETEPPVVLATWWFDRIAHVGRSSPKRLTWKQVSDEHPAVRLLRFTGDPVAAGHLLAEAYDWARLRELLAERAIPDLLSPELAAWMDEGMLSRYLLAELPPLRVLVGEVLDHVTPATGERLLAAFESLLGSRPAA